MKKIIPFILSAALLCCLTAGLTACFANPEPPAPTGDVTSPVTTAKVDENETETTADGDADPVYYTLDNEELGCALTFEAAGNAALEITESEDAGQPALTVKNTQTGGTVVLRAEAPQSKDALDERETQALADGGEQVMLGNYGGYTVPADGEAIVLLEKAPGTDDWFTLRVSAAEGTAIGDALKDAATADFLATMVFNINA